MTIHGLDGLSLDDVELEVSDGGQFVVYQYCLSVIAMTFRRTSDIYFVRSGESAATKGIKWCLVSFLFGWWGIPWGPIWTITTIATNLGGGKDITDAVMNALRSNRASAVQEAIGNGE